MPLFGVVVVVVVVNDLIAVENRRGGVRFMSG